MIVAFARMPDLDGNAFTAALIERMLH